VLERIESPESVLAFRAVGKIDRVDYERVLEPAVRDMLEARGDVRFVYVLGDEFDGYTVSAGWEDAKLGMTDFHKWQRCAVVTNHDWVRHLMGMFGWMMPGDVKVFEVGHEADAIAWAAEES